MPPSIRIDSWDDWTRACNHVSVWRGLIDEICLREEISYRRLHPASANTNAVFLPDHQFVLKIYSPFWDDFDFERTLMEALWTEQQTPVVEAAGCGQVNDADGTSRDYLITRYCPARPFSELRPELSDAEAASRAEQLGRIVRSLHELDVSHSTSPSTDQIWSGVLTNRRRTRRARPAFTPTLDGATIRPSADCSIRLIPPKVPPETPTQARLRGTHSLSSHPFSDMHASDHVGDRRRAARSGPHPPERTRPAVGPAGQAEPAQAERRLTIPARRTGTAAASRLLPHHCGHPAGRYRRRRTVARLPRPESVVQAPARASRLGRHAVPRRCAGRRGQPGAAAGPVRPLPPWSLRRAAHALLRMDGQPAVPGSDALRRQPALPAQR